MMATTPEQRQGLLAGALALAMEQVGQVRATGDNKHDRYTYATDADLLRKVQPAMAKHGLCLAPVGVEVLRGEHQTKSGGSWDRVDVLVTYRLTHKDGGHLDIMAPGTGTDRADKAVYKAMTGAYKYALRQTFAVPTGDDVEDGSPPERVQRTQQRPEPARQAEPQGAHPSWDEDEQAWFLLKLEAKGWTLAMANRWCVEHANLPPLSQATNANRRDFLAGIDKGAVDWKDVADDPR